MKIGFGNLVETWFWQMFHDQLSDRVVSANCKEKNVYAFVIELAAVQLSFNHFCVYIKQYCCDCVAQ